MQILFWNFVQKCMVLTIQGGGFFSYVVVCDLTLSMIRSLRVRSDPDSKILSLYCISARTLPLSIDSEEMQQHRERTKTCPMKQIRTRNSVIEIQSNLRSYIRLSLSLSLSLALCVCVFLYTCECICVYILHYSPYQKY